MKPEYRIKELERENARLEARATEAEKHLAATRESVTRLNRRCTDAEAAARANVEACRAAGQSLGRQLANWTAGDVHRQLDALRARNIELDADLAQAQAVNDAAPPAETARHDRSAVCAMGDLLLSGNKQCYSADAVLRMVRKLLEDPRAASVLAELKATAPHWILGLPPAPAAVEASS